MKKTGIIVALIIIAIVVIVKSCDFKRIHVVNWEESFNEKSTNPYGVSVFYKELPKLFKDNSIRTIYYTPSTYLYANSIDSYGDHIAEGNYVIIGNSDYLDEYDIEELLNFTAKGNTLFISDYYPAQKIIDTLHLKIGFNNKVKDSTSLFTFTNTKLKDKQTKIDKLDGNYYFSEIGQDSYKVLGHVKDSIERTNFIEIPHIDGRIILHLEPKAFTNYNLLKNENYKYVEGVLNYLPTEDVYFDSYTKMFDAYYGNVEEESNLSWFLEQIAFKWAWYLALILTLLFMIFNAKRRQRIIKTIKPLENTTVGFVKTISNLYYETEDHKNIIDKKITYFLEKIRTDYNLNTSKLDDEFAEKLSQKSGKSLEEVTKLVKYINWLRSKKEFFEENLINLNRHIEVFYSK
ncbi:MAG: DUF4350 domain-containing protein [Flavobacteriaceae bacterium]|nr:DUF4350 domain-containing protein [Flavobacteriaceae bacterium]